MKKEPLYLDTSVPSAYYDNRAEERQEATIRFWEEVLPHYQVCISTTTIEELEATKDEGLRRNFERLVKGTHSKRQRYGRQREETIWKKVNQRLRPVQSP